ncbi:MAG: hypothetical protein GF368_02350 [Candidatus Aenigmarchaeota archaeon]|nr:hypothetical protein [Candidatus Aenigmarchaeota archaeon]
MSEESSNQESNWRQKLLEDIRDYGERAGESAVKAVKAVGPEAAVAAVGAAGLYQAATEDPEDETTLQKIRRYGQAVASALLIGGAVVSALYRNDVGGLRTKYEVRYPVGKRMVGIDLTEG